MSRIPSENTKAGIFRQYRPKRVASPQSGRKLPPLSLSRPHGPFRGEAVHDMEGLRRHGFKFNRKAILDDLGDISPAHLDKYDMANYVREGHLWVSKHNPRFVLADIYKVSESTVIAMLALDKCLVMRRKVKTVEGKERAISIYLAAEHTWAIWGWCEAAARGEISKKGNILVHTDDHPDLMGEGKSFSVDSLSMDNIDRVIEAEIKSDFDPTGIGSFIVAAATIGLIGKGHIFWEYSSHITAESKSSYKKLKAELEKVCARPDPEGVRNTPEYKEWSLEQIRPHSHYKKFKRGPLFGFRSDNFPFETAAALQKKNQAADIILDIDIDVDDAVSRLRNIAKKHIVRSGWAKAVTIAVSPPFGARLNHAQKVMVLLKLLKQDLWTSTAHL